MSYFREAFDRDDEEVGEFPNDLDKVEWQQFMGSRVWDVTVGWLTDMLVSARDDLENMGKMEGATLADFAFMQGVCYAIREFMKFPEYVIEHIELNQRMEDENA